MSLELLRPLLGRWEGQATVFVAGRDPMVVRHTELVRTRNAGTILTIEGRSFSISDGADPVFTAFAVVTPEPDGTLRIHSYSSGYFVETACEVAVGRFAWTIPGPPQVRYEATFDAQHWTEVGCSNGRKVFHMELAPVHAVGVRM